MCVYVCGWLGPRYATPDKNGVQYVILANILVGEPCTGTMGKATPDTKKNSHILHESMVDNIRNPFIFVLGAGTDDHAYPSFIIKFNSIVVSG